MSVGVLDAKFGGSDRAERVFSVRLLAETMDPVPGAGGVPIPPQKTLDEVTTCDVTFVPALVPDPVWYKRFEEPGGAFSESLRDWVRKRYADGAMLVSLCTGSFLLAEAGLLAGLPATTHWAAAEHFSRLFPEVDLDARRPLVVTGDAGRIIMGGTGTYHSDLVIYLVQRLAGRAVAHAFARTSGKFWAGDERDVYARLLTRLCTTDSVVRDAQAWFSENMDVDDPVQKMAERANLVDRTFVRRFKDATGQTPLAYTQAVRVERAREMLEATRRPVSEIALSVGYRDISHFSHLFQREVGITPGAYRKRFKLPPVARALK